MIRLSSLRARLVGTVFLGILSAWVAIYLIVKITGTEDQLHWKIGRAHV